MYKVNLFKKHLRDLKKNLVTIMGLSISLAAVVLSIAYLVFENSYDSFWPGADRIYIIKSNVSFESGRRIVSQSTSHLVKEHLENHSTDIEGVCRSSSVEDYVRVGSSSYNQEILYADPEYLDIFGIDVESGSAAGFGQPDRAILTKEFAEKAFGEYSAVGQYFDFQDRRYLVSGIVSSPPPNSTQSYDIILPIRNYVLDNDPGRYFLSVKTYVKILNKDVDLEAVAGLATDYYLSRGSSNTECFAFPLSMVYSSGRRGENNSKAAFIIAAVFVLAMSVINFSNKFAARTEHKLKSFAIRKSFGASMERLLLIIFSDVMVIAFSSILLGLIICNLTIEHFRSLIGIDLRLLGKGLLLTPLIIFALVILVSFIVSLPASLRFARMSVVKILNTRDKSSGSPFSFRKLPLLFQYIVSLTLIAYLVVQAMQMNYMSGFDNGTDTENRVLITLSRGLMMSFDRFAEKLESVPGIISVSGKTQGFGSHYGADIRLPEWDNETKLVAYGYCVQDGFFDVMGIDLIEGQSFKDLPGKDSSKVIIDLYTADLLGLDDPVGSSLKDDYIDCEVIGVVENTNLMPLSLERRPVIYNQIKRYSSELVIKHHGSFNDISDQLEKTLQEFDADYVLEFQALSDRFSEYYKSERNNLKLISWLTVIAVFLCLSGVYAIVSYRIQTEQKNISIKKIMGASLKDLNLLFSKELIIMILASALIAFPVALLLISQWLNNYISRIRVGAIPFILSFVVIAVLSLLLVLYKNSVIVRINPVDVLDTD